MPNVTVYRDSNLTAEDIAGFGFEHVGIATGAAWRRDGVARFHPLPIAIDAAMPVFTPDDIMDGKLPAGHVVIYDDDHYYLAGVLAELLVRNGNRVTFLTQATKVSDWSTQTLDQPFIQARILELGVDVLVTHALSRVGASSVTAACTYTGRGKAIACAAVLLVTARLPNDGVYRDLKAMQESWVDHGIESVRVFGDAQAPAAIAWATYAGHRYAEELEAPEPKDGVPFKRVLAAMEA
jgi:dimethylamine/trimethylamine dehydrogenase